MARRVSWADYDRENLRGIVEAFLVVVSGDYAGPEISEAELLVRWVGKETLRVTVTKDSLKTLLDRSAYQLRLQKGKKGSRQQYLDRLQNFFDALRQMAGCQVSNEGRVWKLKLELAGTNRDRQQFLQALDQAWEQAKAAYHGDSLDDNHSEVKKLKEIDIEENKYFTEVYRNVTPAQLSPLEKTNAGKEPKHHCHLVVIASREQISMKPSQTKLRLYNKICYREPETGKVSFKVLPNNFNNLETDIEGFSDTLRQLITVTERFLLRQLKGVYPRPQVIANLYLPYELLKLPSEYWLGRKNTTLKVPIVIGCSDRYNPQLDEYQTLYEKAIDAWNCRFLPHVANGNALNNLKWFNCQNRDEETWETHSAYHCHSDWLEEEDNWHTVITSGIPLIIWRSNWRHEFNKSSPQTAYDYLTQHDRFTFLEKLANVQQQGQRLGQPAVSVFYEDMTESDYYPDPPDPFS